MNAADQATSVPAVTAMENELAEAIKAAIARAEAVYAKGNVTLVDQLSSAEWLALDGSDENCLVADSDALVDDDCGYAEIAA